MAGAERPSERQELPAEVQRLRDAARETLALAGLDTSKPGGRTSLLSQPLYRAWDKKEGIGAGRQMFAPFRERFNAIEAKLIDPKSTVSYSEIVEYFTTQFMIDSTKMEFGDPKSDLLKDMNLRRVYWIFDEAMLEDYALTVQRYAQFAEKVPGLPESARDKGLEARALKTLQDIKEPLEGVALVSRLCTVRELARQLPSPKKERAQEAAQKIEDQLIAKFDGRRITIAGVKKPGETTDVMLTVRKGMPQDELVQLMHEWSRQVRAKVGEAVDYKVETSTTKTRLEELARTIGKSVGLPVLGDGAVDTYQARVPHALYGKAVMQHNAATVDAMFPKKEGGGRRYELRTPAQIQAFADSLVAADGEWRQYAQSTIGRQTDVTALLFLKGQLGLYVNAERGLEPERQAGYEKGRLPPAHRKGLETDQPLRNVGALTHYVAIIQKGYMTKVSQAQALEDTIKTMKESTFGKLAEAFNSLKPILGDIAWKLPGTAAALVGMESLIPPEIRKIQDVQALFAAARGMARDMEVAQAQLAKNKAELQKAADEAQRVLQLLEKRIASGAKDATPEDMKLVSDMCDSLLGMTVKLADTNETLAPHIKFHALHANAYAGRHDISWGSIATGVAVTDWMTGAWGARGVTSFTLGKVPAWVIERPTLMRIPLVKNLVGAAGDTVRAGGSLAGRGVQMTSPTYWAQRYLLSPRGNPLLAPAESLAAEWSAIEKMPRGNPAQVTAYTDAKKAFEQKAIAFRDRLNDMTAKMKPQQAAALRRELVGVLAGQEVSQTQMLLVDAAHELGIAPRGSTLPPNLLRDKMVRLRLPGPPGQAAAAEMLKDATFGPKLRAALAAEDEVIKGLLAAGTKMEAIGEATWVQALTRQAQAWNPQAPELMIRSGLAGRTGAALEAGAEIGRTTQAARAAELAEAARTPAALRLLGQVEQARTGLVAKAGQLGQGIALLEAAGTDAAALARARAVLQQAGIPGASTLETAKLLEQARTAQASANAALQDLSAAEKLLRNGEVAAAQQLLGKSSGLLRALRIGGGVLAVAAPILEGIALHGAIVTAEYHREVLSALQKNIGEMFSEEKGFEKQGNRYVHKITGFSVDFSGALSLSQDALGRALTDRNIAIGTTAATVAGTILFFACTGPVGWGAGIGVAVVGAGKWVINKATEVEDNRKLRDALGKLDPRIFQYFTMQQITGFSNEAVNEKIGSWIRTDMPRLVSPKISREWNENVNGARRMLAASMVMDRLRQHCPVPLDTLSLPDGTVPAQLLASSPFGDMLLREILPKADLSKEDLAARVRDSGPKAGRLLIAHAYEQWSVEVERLNNPSGEPSKEFLQAWQRQRMLGRQYLGQGKLASEYVEELRAGPVMGGGFDMGGREERLGALVATQVLLGRADLAEPERTEGGLRRLSLSGLPAEDVRALKSPENAEAMGRLIIQEAGVPIVRLEHRGLPCLRADLGGGKSCDFAFISGQWMWSTTASPDWRITEPCPFQTSGVRGTMNTIALRLRKQEDTLGMRSTDAKQDRKDNAERPREAGPALVYAETSGASELIAAGCVQERGPEGRSVFVLRQKTGATERVDRFTAFGGRWFLQRENPENAWETVKPSLLDDTALDAKLRAALTALTGAASRADALKLDPRKLELQAEDGLNVLLNQTELPVTFERDYLGVPAYSVPVPGGKAYFALIGGGWHWATPERPRLVPVTEGRYDTKDKPLTDPRHKANNIAEMLAAGDISVRTLGIRRGFEAQPDYRSPLLYGEHAPALRAELFPGDAAAPQVMLGDGFMAGGKTQNESLTPADREALRTLASLRGTMPGLTGIAQAGVLLFDKRVTGGEEQILATFVCPTNGTFEHPHMVYKALTRPAGVPDAPFVEKAPRSDHLKDYLPADRHRDFRERVQGLVDLTGKDRETARRIVAEREIAKIDAADPPLLRAFRPFVQAAQGAPNTPIALPADFPPFAKLNAPPGTAFFLICTTPDSRILAMRRTPDGKISYSMHQDVLPLRQDGKRSAAKEAQAIREAREAQIHQLAAERLGLRRTDGSFAVKPVEAQAKRQKEAVERLGAADAWIEDPSLLRRGDLTTGQPVELDLTRYDLARQLNRFGDNDSPRVTQFRRDMAMRLALLPPKKRADLIAFVQNTMDMVAGPQTEVLDPSAAIDMLTGPGKTWIENQLNGRFPVMTPAGGTGTITPAGTTPAGGE